jgi:hypothetical protein
MKRITETIMDVITVIDAVVFILSACCLDSMSFIPMIALLVSGAWLVFQAYRKGAFTL